MPRNTADPRAHAVQRSVEMRLSWCVLLVGISACAHAAKVASSPGSRGGPGGAALAGRPVGGTAAPFVRAPDDGVIASVQIAGLDDATAATLRSALRTRPGMRFGDAPIKDDLQRL